MQQPWVPPCGRSQVGVKWRAGWCDFAESAAAATDVDGDGGRGGVFECRTDPTDPASVIVGTSIPLLDCAVVSKSQRSVPDQIASLPIYRLDSTLRLSLDTLICAECAMGWREHRHPAWPCRQPSEECMGGQGKDPTPVLVRGLGGNPGEDKWYAYAAYTPTI